MKKVVVFIVLAMVLINYCTAQSANNDAQRIVGTWTQDDGTVWVFNINGTGTYGNTNFFYGISAGGKIFITDWYSNTYDLYMSPDGRRMIIYGYVFQKK